MKRFIAKVVIPVALVLCILFTLPLVCGHEHAHSHHNGHGHSHTPGHAHSHSHSHGHEHAPHHHHEVHEEPAAYRWSKQANEQYQEPDEPLEHPAHKWSQETNEIRDDEALKPFQKSEDRSSKSSKESEQASKTPQKSSVWLEAICATLAISIAPYLILFIIPVTNSKEHEPYLKVLLAFASGGLLGDAFLHLIPHALIAQSSSGGHAHSHSHSHSHDAGAEGGHGGHDISIGLAVLGGIIAFLVVEKFVRIFKGGHMHSHSHSHSHALKSETNGGGKSDGEKHKRNGEKSGEKHKNGEKNDEKQKKGDKKKGSKGSSNQGDIKVAGYLNLAADFTHNLTDGLAIGASFLAGKSVGIVTTLTIFLHEIPHEIGDFAILLQSGCTRRKAMMLQLVTALGALTGTFISLLAEGADESAISWILPFTAGGFIYIATVSVIPELLENTRFWQSVFEVVALLSGVALMMGIAHLEEMGHEH